MSTAVRITYDEYEAMIARGEFDEDPRRYELIHAEIVPMPPIGFSHQEATNKLTRWSVENTRGDEVCVQIQGPLGMPILESMPEPDVSWLRERDYSTRRARPEDVLLVIEVADSSLDYDRTTKARLYAAGGVADYWIANIPGRCFEVHRDPGPDGYRTVTVSRAGDVIRPLAFPEIGFFVALIFPH